MTRSVIVTGDDFGLSETVNEAIERAHRDGVLTHASLMIAGPAAQDAVRRARRLRTLNVGLHLVTVDGPALLSPSEIPDLVDDQGWFHADQLSLALKYAFVPWVRRQLAAEIRAQFAAYAATGLRLNHADAHKHMHLHPTVGRLLLRVGADHDLRHVRVPAEPPRAMRRCGVKTTWGSRALYLWTRTLRRRVRQAGMSASGAVFGLAWTGHMTEERVLALLAHLPDGESELYFHPATRRDEWLQTLMPGYEHTGELAALLSPRVRAALAAAVPAAGPTAADAAAPAKTPASSTASPPS